MTTSKLLDSDDLRSRFKHATANAPYGKTGDVVVQIRYALAVSRLNPSSRSRNAAAAPLSDEAAQLTVLVQAADKLTLDVVRHVLKKIDKLDDVTLQLDLKSQLFDRLPDEPRRQLVESVWEQVSSHPPIDPSVHARVLFRLFEYVGDIQESLPETFLTILDIANNIEGIEARTRSLIVLSRYVPLDMTLAVQRSVLEPLDDVTDDAVRSSAIANLCETLLPELMDATLERALAIHSLDERVRALAAVAHIVPPERTREVQNAALTAIEGITKEESIVRALTVFAPHLDYMRDRETFPEILERALAVAIKMPRRNLRVRALVVLAPHLPPELQGEALAAVHALPKASDRATLLAELARELPPEMLVASLAVAHTMQEQDARVHALAALARHVPEHAREQTIRDALDAAVHLPRLFERVSAIIDLMDILPDDLRQQMISLALKLTSDIQNENTRARALGMLSDYLTDEMLEQAVEIAYSFEIPGKCLMAMMGIVEYLPEDKQKPMLKDMLALTREIRHEYEQSRALRSLAELLPPELIGEALIIVGQIEDPYDRLSAIIPLVQNMSPSDRPALIGEAWKLIKYVDSGYDRASALAAIAPLLPPAAEKDLSRAVGMAIGSIMDEYDQASAIILLAPLMIKKNGSLKDQSANRTMILREGIKMALQANHQNERIALLRQGIALWVENIPADERLTHDTLWSNMMMQIGDLPLADVILCIGVLLPLLAHLGGEHNVQEWMRAMGLPN